MAVERPRSEIRKMLWISAGGAAVGALAGIAAGILTHASPGVTAAYGFGGLMGGGILTLGLLGDN